MWVYDDELRKREARLRETGFDSYCLFTLANSETRAAKELNHLNEGCVAVPFLRMKRAGAARASILVQEALLKGYVFLFVPRGYVLQKLQHGKTVFRVLDRKENGGLLIGKNREYAEMVLSQGGILSASKAIQFKDRIKIISGPLIDLQGRVTGFSSRNKNYRVEFEMMGHKVSTWLPFELIEPAGAWMRKDELYGEQGCLLRLGADVRDRKSMG